MRKIPTTYFCTYDPYKKYCGNTCQTNIKGSKMIWVPKVKI